ncbi:hypothetical protein A1O3_00235 [Capronia epimyces CBS 606.96]|uniref:histone acetyltransferase n=1 Tax=Capronia epimyces CBS 606.96 TaxID=1182542 RepID=W9YPT7_9EURO|nr:uncharacterized protein A1O3_00235 [Capronia epimyces CBS 606.96]EXJ91685.1 hypothetical protein A1O3_00235 [Capronia epimyces CBS 606.96]
MPARPPLQSRLAASLPVGISLRSYHASSTPSSTTTLFASLPGELEEATLCESHFLAVASPQHDDSREVLVYAVEILIFTSPSLTTLFVSKADSSGFSSRLNAPKGSPSIVGSVIATFVEFLLEPRLNQSRVVLSLFARSQNQYLFPGSIENVGKHVLDDRQLIKWWCRVMDNVLRRRNDGLSLPCRATAHLLVPGCDRAETKALFPPSSHLDSPSAPNWINSYPAELLVADTSKPPRHLIPRLPDDPKSRFLDDLDGEFVDERGQWRSVKTLDQFWEMMSYRQECSAGRLVGFLWLVFPSSQSAHAPLNLLEETGKMRDSVKLSTQTNQSTPRSVQVLEYDSLNSGVQPDGGSRSIEAPKPPRASSPRSGSQTDPTTVARLGNEAGKGSLTTAVASAEQPMPTISIESTKGTQGQIVLDADQYQSLLDWLLQSDFAGEELAAESTKGWVQKALELSGGAVFGQPINGERPLTLPKAHEPAAAQHVNVLTGVRKKRKADSMMEARPAFSEGGPTSRQASVNTLPTSLVRKKAKG